MNFGDDDDNADYGNDDDEDGADDNGSNDNFCRFIRNNHLLLSGRAHTIVHYFMGALTQLFIYN